MPHDIIEESCSIEEYGIPDLDGPVEWPSLFGNANPVEIEIGCGKGRFLINSAMTFPEINYVGVEWTNKYIRLMKERVAKRELTNVRLFREDAWYFVRKFAPDASITAYHAYFPDPWPKRRHHKRRLFKPEFVAQIERTLIPGGTIDVASDYEAYFKQIISLLDDASLLERMDELPDRVRQMGDGMTNYEVKYTEEGRKIFRTAYNKKGASHVTDR